MVDHLPNVKTVAWDLYRKLPVSVEIEDLIQAGTVGLIDAADKFEPNRKYRFWTYAYHRVKGQMLDMLRGIDGAGRTTRSMQKKSDALFWDYHRKYGTAPSDQQMADGLAITLTRWMKWKVRLLWTSEIQAVTKGDFYESSVPVDIKDKNAVYPDKTAGMTEMQKHLAEVIATLPEREREVLIGYFYKEETLATTGKRLNMVESRASQLKKVALEMLRRELVARGIGSSGAL